jgi:hypothetical protein
MLFIVELCFQADCLSFVIVYESSTVSVFLEEEEEEAMTYPASK